MNNEDKIIMGGSMHGLNAIGNPLEDIKNTMSGRIDKFNTEFDRIHQEM